MSAPELPLQNSKPILTPKASLSEPGRSRWSQGEPPRLQNASRDIERPPRTHPLSLPMNLTSVGTSRCDVPARESAGGIVAPLNAARTAQRAVPTWFRIQFAKFCFMGSPPFIFRMHWDHEPPPHPPFGHPLPLRGGEGWGEGAVYGEPPAESPSTFWEEAARSDASSSHSDKTAPIRPLPNPEAPSARRSIPPAFRSLPLRFPNLRKSRAP